MDNRKHIRYYAKDRAIVMVSSGFEDSGYHVIDISKGGLALRYLGAERWTELFDEVHIKFNERFFIPNLPVKVISDSLINSSYISLRRLGVQFGKLTNEQENLLDQFLNCYIEGEVKQLAMAK